MDGVGIVGVEGGAVSELHEAAKPVALCAGRTVKAGGRVQDTGDLSLQSGYLFEYALLLLLGDAWFPAEGEHVDEHGDSVTIEP